jgi:hypothetical protein
VLEKCDMFLQFVVNLNIHWMHELSQKSSKSIIKFVLINIYKCCIIERGGESVIEKCNPFSPKIQVLYQCSIIIQ